MPSVLLSPPSGDSRSRNRREHSQRCRCPLCRSSVHAPLPIEVRAVSALPIEAVVVPEAGGRCHFDRNYRFLHLGSFSRPGILYLLSSNEDRKTPSTDVMWIIEASIPCARMYLVVGHAVPLAALVRCTLCHTQVHRAPQLSVAPARHQRATGSVAPEQWLHGELQSAFLVQQRRAPRAVLGPGLFKGLLSEGRGSTVGDKPSACGALYP